MPHVTDPDFPAPRICAVPEPPDSDCWPAGAVFVVLDLFTPWRSEYPSLAEAIESASTARFPDDLMILVYAADHRCLGVLSASGIDVGQLLPHRPSTSPIW
jgi:hypothetical protein